MRRTGYRPDRTRLDTIMDIALILFVVLIIVAGVLLFHYYKQAYDQKVLNEEVINVRKGQLKFQEYSENSGAGDENHSINPGTNTNIYEETADVLAQMNSDYMCFLTLDEKHMFPVVQSDNDFYLHHNFKKERSSRGTIFLDQSCWLTGPVALFHGHHMKDGSMFGVLPSYLNEEYRKMHPFFSVDYGSGESVYEIFAIGLFDIGQEDHFKFYELPDNREDLQSYVNAFRNNSVWKLGDQDFVFENEKDGEIIPKLVLLSTCEYRGVDQRLVVAAVYRPNIQVK